MRGLPYACIFYIILVNLLEYIHICIYTYVYVYILWKSRNICLQDRGRDKRISVRCIQNFVVNIVMFILIVMFIYSYCLYALFCVCCFHRANWHSPITLTEVFPCFFLSCKTKCQGIPRKDRARSALFLISEFYCSIYCLYRLCFSMYCLCVNVYWTTATGWQPNRS